MSRIGKLPIDLTDNIKVTVKDYNIEINHNNKIKNYLLSYGVSAMVENDQLKIFAKDTSIPKVTMFVGMDRSNQIGRAHV